MESIFSVIDALINRRTVITWINQYFDLITGNDVLILFCIALPLIGLGIGLIRRLVRIRA